MGSDKWGQNLFILVKEENWKQAQAAERFGVSQSRVSGLLRGKRDKFSLDMLVTLAIKTANRRRVEHNFRHNLKTRWNMVKTTDKVMTQFLDDLLVSVRQRVKADIDKMNPVPALRKHQA